MIFDVENCRSVEMLWANFSRRHDIPFPGFMFKTVTQFSAMRPVLRYLKHTGIINDKNSPILVSSRIGCSMLQMMRKYCAPVLTTQAPLKAILVHHQFGFPQNMDEIFNYCDRKKIVVLEDCSDLFEGYYKGRRLGTLGLAGIFEFSKIFPSLLGGGLTTLDEELYQFAESDAKNDQILWVRAMLVISTYFIRWMPHKSYYYLRVVSEGISALAEHAQAMNRFSQNIIAKRIRAEESKRRKENYLTLLDRFEKRPYFSGLAREGVYPYIAPLFAEALTIKKIVMALRHHGIVSQISDFDRHQNILNPHFEQCASIPIHSGLTSSDMHKICDIIERAS